MLLKLTHETNMTYSDLVHETVMELRMCPRQDQDQHRLSFDLSVGPPTQATSYFDWLGNSVHAFTIAPFHRQVRIIANSVVETERTISDIGLIRDTWPLPTDWGYSEGGYSLYDYLHFGGPIVDSALLQELVASMYLQQGMKIGDVVWRFLNLINEKFEYKKGMTTAASPITDCLEHRSGVCQDFTHLMIGLGRAVGIPARYVSGYVHPLQDSKIRGYTQTHAWCELLFPETGWVGFDPTNNCLVGNNFVKLAVGRHYSDVPPHRGLYKGVADETMTVTVNSEELDGVPSQLVAERTQSLSLPTYGGWRDVTLAGARQLEEQQQQQQQQQQQEQQQQ